MILPKFTEQLSEKFPNQNVINLVSYTITAYVTLKITVNLFSMLNDYASEKIKHKINSCVEKEEINNSILKLNSQITELEKKMKYEVDRFKQSISVIPKPLGNVQTNLGYSELSSYKGLSSLDFEEFRCGLINKSGVKNVNVEEIEESLKKSPWNSVNIYPDTISSEGGSSTSCREENVDGWVQKNAKIYKFDGETTTEFPVDLNLGNPSEVIGVENSEIYPPKSTGFANE